MADGTAIEQARGDIEALKQRAAEEGWPARDLYWAVLERLDAGFPSVFMTLTGRGLYDLVRKGSQPVSGEVLKAYRERKAKQLEVAWQQPIPEGARSDLVRLVEGLWGAAYPVALREAQDVAEVRNRDLRERVAELESASEALAGNFAAAQAELAASQERLQRAMDRQQATAAELASAEGRLVALNTETLRLQDELKRDRTQFGERVAQLTSALEAAQQAYEGLSRRSLMDIEAARQELAGERRRTEQLEKGVAQLRLERDAAHEQEQERQVAFAEQGRRLAAAEAELSRLRHREKGARFRQPRRGDGLR